MLLSERAAIQARPIVDPNKEASTSDQLLITLVFITITLQVLVREGVLFTIEFNFPARKQTINSILQD